jgi:hypothetical protein
MKPYRKSRLKATGADRIITSALFGTAPYMQHVASDASWGTTWTHVVAGKWSSSWANGLLFYDQSAGTAEFYSTDGFGNRSLLQRYTNWRQSWSQIVPGYYYYLDSTYSGVLLYDPTAGYVAIYSTDGSGSISIAPIIEQYTRTTWTHIVPGFFTTSLLTSLVFYSQSEGYAEVWMIDDATGALKIVSSFDFWRTSWTHLVAGRFKAQNWARPSSDPPRSFPCSDLFFYEGSTGHGELYVSNGGGLVLYENSYDGLPIGATSVLSGNFSGDAVQTSDLVFHNGDGLTAGHLSFWKFTQGSPVTISSFDELDPSASGLRPTSNVIVVGKFCGEPEDHWFFDGPIGQKPLFKDDDPNADVRMFRASLGGYADFVSYDQAAGIGEFFLRDAIPSSIDVNEPIWGYARATTVHGIRGVVSTGSLLPGQSIDLHVNSQVGAYTIKIYTLTGTFMAEVTGLPTDPSPLAIPRYAYRDGAQWPLVASFPIPSNWESGVYLARVEALNPGYAAVDLPFVVRCPTPGSPNRILVVIDDGTYEAYNVWGGRSLYGNSVNGPIFTAPEASDGLAPYAFKVSFDRPYVNMFDDRIKWQEHEKPFAQWLAQRGIGADWCTSRDLDLDVPSSEYRLLVFLPHHEYWTIAMRNNVSAFTSAGGNVAYFAGNVCWWQVRYDYKNNQVVCYKRAGFDPLLSSTPSLTTVHWIDPPVNWSPSGLSPQQPQSALTGVVWGSDVTDPAQIPDDRMSFDALPGQLNHWVFEGAVQKMLDKPYPSHSFGLTYDSNYTVVGYETDTTDTNTPANFVPLATAFRPSQQATVATLGLFQPNPCSTVFTAACQNWSWGLATANAMEQITYNVITRLSNVVSGPKRGRTALPPSILSLLLHP